MQLVIASNNAHKIQEIRDILAPWFEEVHSMGEMGIHKDVIEDGDTFTANAEKKAVEIAALLPDCAVLADDSGLCVDALDGAPGVYSARYAGEGHDDAANNAKLLAALADVPDENRGAQFMSVIALARPNRPLLLVKGICAGKIGHELVGENGFGYDPLFILPESGCTFAQLSPDEKNRISHRSRALAALKEALAAEKNTES